MNKIYKLALKGFTNYFTSNLDHLLKTSYSKPFIVSSFVTSACNSKCKQCDSWKKKRPVYELSLNEWKSIISKLHKWLGTFYFCICGGEPMLRQDIFKLINYANRNGLITAMITNSYLINKNNAKNIINSGLDRLTISIDGLDNIHDYLRGVDGAFIRVKTALKYINDMKEKYKSNLKLSINTAITKFNLHQISEMINFATQDKCSIYFRPIFPNYFSDTSPIVDNTLWPSDYDKVSKAIDIIIRKKREGFSITNSENHLRFIKKYFKNPQINFVNFGLRCKAPSRSIIIDSNGNVVICSTILGNILKDSIDDIWHKLCQLKLSLKNCGKFCILRDGDLNDNLFSEFKRFKTAVGF